MSCKEVRRERLHLQRMSGYVPGTQAGPDTIKLNTNENPFPPSPRVIESLAHVAERSLQRYPDPLATRFREAVAELHQISPEEVIATNGGDELLRLAMTTFLDPDRPLGVVSPSYGVYAVLAGVHQSQLSISPLDAHWALPSDTAQRWNAEGAQLAILTNPHAPSGYLTAPDRLERLAADFDGVLLIDEAYADFIVPALKFDSAAIATRFPNVLVLRTLSKGYGLAGLRLGYGIGSRALIAPLLTKTKDSYNVDSIAQMLGTVALQDQEYAERTWEQVRNERLRLAEGLAALGFSVLPSQANFVLAAIPATLPVETAQVLARSLELAGIYVRWFDEDRLRDKLRITVGTREENIALLSKMAELLTVVR